MPLWYPTRPVGVARGWCLEPAFGRAGCRRGPAARSLCQHVLRGEPAGHLPADDARGGVGVRKRGDAGGLVGARRHELEDEGAVRAGIVDEGKRQEQHHAVARGVVGRRHEAIALARAALGEVDGVVDGAADAAVAPRLARDGAREPAQGVPAALRRRGAGEPVELVRGVRAVELGREESLRQSCQSVAEKRAVVGHGKRAVAQGHVVHAGEVGRAGRQLGERRHESGAELARARRGEAVEVPGDVRSRGGEDGIELLVHGRHEARVKGGETAVRARGEPALRAGARERGREVLAQDAVAARLAHALAGVVPALGRGGRGKGAQGLVPRADLHELGEVADGIGALGACRGARREVAPVAALGLWQPLDPGRLVGLAGAVVAVDEREVPAARVAGARGAADGDADGLGAVLLQVAQGEGHEVARAGGRSRGTRHAPVLVEHGHEVGVEGQDRGEQAEQGGLD